jgi:hypothetical protein
MGHPGLLATVAPEPCCGQNKPCPGMDRVRVEAELGWGLRLGDFAGLDAGGADADALGCAVDEGLDGL